MKLWLPGTWFALAALIAIGHGLRAVPMISLGQPGYVVSVVSVLLPILLFTLAMALSYWLMLRASLSGAIAVLGVINILLYAGGQAALLAGSFDQDAIILGAGTADIGRMTALLGVGGGLLILASLVFIAALITAINTLREPDDAAAFD